MTPTFWYKTFLITYEVFSAYQMSSFIESNHVLALVLLSPLTHLRSWNASYSISYSTTKVKTLKRERRDSHFMVYIDFYFINNASPFTSLYLYKTTIFNLVIDISSLSNFGTTTYKANNCWKFISWEHFLKHMIKEIR